MTNARRELVEFLEKRAFDPILHARPDGKSAADKRRLEDVQDATKAEIQRLRGYGSAKEVVENFRSDLNSEPARKIHSELHSLNLPTINDIREEFEDKARQLGIRA